MPIIIVSRNSDEDCFNPFFLKPITKLIFKKQIGMVGFDKPYNIDATKIIKLYLNNVPLIIVGGMRSLKEMEETVGNNYGQMILMSRPFVRELILLEKFKEGKIDRVNCESCNRCLAAVAFHFPLKCYVNSFPTKK